MASQANTISRTYDNALTAFETDILPGIIDQACTAYGLFGSMVGSFVQGIPEVNAASQHFAKINKGAVTGGLRGTDIVEQRFRYGRGGSGTHGPEINPVSNQRFEFLTKGTIRLFHDHQPMALSSREFNIIKSTAIRNQDAAERDLVNLMKETTDVSFTTIMERWANMMWDNNADPDDALIGIPVLIANSASDTNSNFGISRSENTWMRGNYTTAVFANLGDPADDDFIKGMMNNYERIAFNNGARPNQLTWYMASDCWQVYADTLEGHVDEGTGVLADKRRITGGDGKELFNHGRVLYHGQIPVVECPEAPDGEIILWDHQTGKIIPLTGSFFVKEQDFSKMENATGEWARLAASGQFTQRRPRTCTRIVAS